MVIKLKTIIIYSSKSVCVYWSFTVLKKYSIKVGMYNSIYYSKHKFYSETLTKLSIAINPSHNPICQCNQLSYIPIKTLQLPLAFLWYSCLVVYSCPSLTRLRPLYCQSLFIRFSYQIFIYLQNELIRKYVL